MFYHMYECIEIWNVIHISLYISEEIFEVILDYHQLTYTYHLYHFANSRSKIVHVKLRRFGWKSVFRLIPSSPKKSQQKQVAVKDLCKLENHCSFVCAEKSSNEEVGKDYIAALQPTTRPTPCSKSHTNSSSWSSNDHRWAIMINKQASKHQAGCQAPRQKTQIVKKDLWLASLSSLTTAVGYIISHCFKALKTN